MWHNKLDQVSNFAVLALSFLSSGSAWLLWTLRLCRDIRSDPNYLPPTLLPSPLCLSSFCVDFPSGIKKQKCWKRCQTALEAEMLYMNNERQINTHRYTPALTWQDAVWGEVAINIHILSIPIASANTGGGEATPANFFNNMDIVHKVGDILYTNTDQFTAICLFSM